MFSDELLSGSEARSVQELGGLGKLNRQEPCFLQYAEWLRC